MGAAVTPAILRVRRAAALGDVLAASCVATKLIELQELQAGDSRPAHRKDAHTHRAASQATDGSPRKSYRVRFVFLLSDRKRRDGFGLSETVADCTIRTLRRFVLKEIPDFSFSVEYVAKGREGVRIEIEEI